MSINLPAPPLKYDPSNEAERNRILDLADKRNLKRSLDIDMKDCALYLRSPNGSRFKVMVSNTGVLSTDPA